MMKRCLCLLAAGLTMPTLALSDTLHLPTDATIDVQVIDTVVLDQQTPTRADLLLRPVTGRGAEHELPDYCLITADGRLVEDRVRISAKTLTCIDAEGDAREIFSGEISAAGRDQNGDFGIDACTEGADGDCRRAELDPDRVFKLQFGRELNLEPQENPSERLNEQRRQADGEGVANPIPAERPDPDDE